MGALIHGNLWKDKAEKWPRYTKAAGNSHARAVSALFIPLTARCWKGSNFVWLFSFMGAPVLVSKSAAHVGICLPSGKPSFPGDSLKMEELLERHQQNMTFTKHATHIVNMKSHQTKGSNVHTHSRRSHEDPGDHDLRDGLLSSFCWLS